MEPKALGDQQKLLTDVIKKQIVILGPDITLAKARNVKGLTVADDGTVTDMQGEPHLLTQELVNQFMELSGLIVKKTMEPLLAMSDAPTIIAPTAPIPPMPAIANPAPVVPQSDKQQSETPVSEVKPS